MSTPLRTVTSANGDPLAEAIDLNVPAPVITQALLERLRSRDADSFGNRLLASLRNQFGGHTVKKR